MSCPDCEEYEEMLRTCMDEKCTANEKHCTCVPILRRRIHQLEGADLVARCQDSALDEAKKLIEEMEQRIARLEAQLADR